MTVHIHIKLITFVWAVFRRGSFTFHIRNVPSGNIPIHFRRSCLHIPNRSLCYVNFVMITRQKSIQSNICIWTSLKCPDKITRHTEINLKIYRFLILYIKLKFYHFFISHLPQNLLPDLLHQPLTGLQLTNLQCHIRAKSQFMTCWAAAPPKVECKHRKYKQPHFCREINILTEVISPSNI